ncbi:MAG: glycosyltransferase [Chitinophagaceae bacterium]
MNEQIVKVLHVSSRYEECGVAKYLHQYIESMKDLPSIQNEYFAVSPYETYNMKPTDLVAMAAQLEQKLVDFDVLHIQHEFGLYAQDSFRQIIDAGVRAGKRIVVTVHTSPGLASKPVRLHGVGPRSVIHYLREQRRRNAFLGLHIEPLKKADIVIAHNNLTIQSLQDCGIDSARIHKTLHPVQVFPEPPVSTRIAKALHKQKDDIIYCTIGFIHRYKGIVDSIKALKFLPENYKYVVLGGMKSDSDDVVFYDKVCDLIDTLGLKDRVYISGYVQDDNELNALIRECDICVYPFDRVYYANVSSGSMNLAFANSMPAIAYPTAAIKEVADVADGALILCETFAYYELARELQRVDMQSQSKLSQAYAEKMAWPKSSNELLQIYKSLIG